LHVLRRYRLNFPSNIVIVLISILVARFFVFFIVFRVYISISLQVLGASSQTPPRLCPSTPLGDFRHPNPVFVPQQTPSYGPGCLAQSNVQMTVTRNRLVDRLADCSRYINILSVDKPGSANWSDSTAYSVKHAQYFR